MTTLVKLPLSEHPELVAPAVWKALTQLPGLSLEQIEVAEIDPKLSDTEAFCEHYGWAPGDSANTMIVEAARAGVSRPAVVVKVASGRADLNNIVRKALDARRVSFASMEMAVEQSGMEYGGITVIGLPEEWPVLVDEKAVRVVSLIMGSGIRKSKIFVPGEMLSRLPNARVMRLERE